MSAPSIPHLATLGARGGLRNRMRGRGSGPSRGEAQAGAAQAGDTAVQQTDSDAISARMSAVSLGYLDDPYATSLCAKTPDAAARRYPIINRGTYVRTTAIDTLIERWLDMMEESMISSSSSSAQILSLGAGSDSRPFRLLATRHCLAYHETDFEQNVRKKIAAVQTSQTLQQALRTTSSTPSVSDEPDRFVSAAYSCHPLDLRHLTSSNIRRLIPGLRPDVPTLILSECCLCYSDPASTASSILGVLVDFFASDTSLATIIYEPIRPSDSFGRTMTSNLASRGISMPTLALYPTLQSQRDRLRLAGFTTGQGARDIEHIFHGTDVERWIDDAERVRIEGLEWLDEVEEWRLLASHYCVAWAWRDGRGSAAADVFTKAWSNIIGAWTSSEDQHDSDTTRRQ